MNNLFRATTDAPRFTLKTFFIKHGGRLFNSEADQLLAAMQKEGLAALVRELKRQKLSMNRDKLLASLHETRRVTAAFSLTDEQATADIDALIETIRPTKK